jgi:dipeptidyl aminopeptidase/acylaminoacyl peptidase
MNRPPAPEDAADVETVEDVRLSPDGEWVAYVPGGETRRAGDDRPQLWTRPFEGGVPARLEGGPHTSPRWSPDGAWLAFLGGSRLHLAAPDPARQAWVPRRSWELPPGVRDLEWTPDGQRLSFVAAGRLLLLDPATGEAAPLAPQALRGLQPRHYAWAPGGRTLAFVDESGAGGAGGAGAAEGEHEGWLSVLDLSPGLPPGLPAGEVRRLGPTHDATIMLAFSPDGRTLAWLGREHAPQSTQLELYDLEEEGEVPPRLHVPPRKRALCATLPGSIKWVGFLPDGRLAAAVLRGLRVGLFSIDPRSGDCTEVLAPGDPGHPGAPGSLGAGSFTRFGVSFDAGADRLASTCSGPREPANVVAGEWGRPLRRLTRLNAHLEGVSLGETEYVTWAAPDGLPLEGLLVTPPGYREGPPYPTILELHGGPRRSWWDTCQLTESWAQLLAGAGYAVLLPNPRGSSGRGPDFVRANTGDLGGQDLQDCLAGLDALIARGVADPDRLGVCGWSYGGYLTSWCITQTGRFKAAVAGASISNFLSWMGQAEMGRAWAATDWRQPLVAYEDPQRLLRRSPVLHARQVRTPALFLHGDSDTKIGALQAVEMHSALKALGVPTELVRYPGAGHQISDREQRIDSQRRVLAWFERWL